MPGRAADDLLRHAPAQQPEDPPQARVGGLHELAQDDGRGGPLGEPGALAGLAAVVDPADRGVVDRQALEPLPALVGVRARVDRGEVVERRRPGRILAHRSGARLLEAPERLVERGPEGAVDRHDLAGRLHLRAEAPVGRRELVEREARQLDHDVVQRGLEGSDRRPRDHVGDLGQRPARRDLGRDARDRVARRLRRQRGRPRHARVDLDDRVLGRVRRERELDVAAALHAQRADDRERRAPQPLVDGVGERLDGRDDDRVAGVDAERVHVLHRAHGDARVLGVAHDLVLDLLPAHEAALDHDLLDGARPEARADALPVRLLGLHDAAAGAAQRERGPDDGGQADGRRGPPARRRGARRRRRPPR